MRFSGPWVGPARPLCPERFVLQSADVDDLLMRSSFTPPLPLPDDMHSSAPAALAALQESAKGALMYGLSGRPISITATQTIFALAVTVSEERPQEDYFRACDELLAEGAIDHYIFVNHTDRYRTGNGNIDTLSTMLATPVVLAVRRRGACTTRVGPAAL